jgi:glutathione-independent formaldehyde dehydrogenase
MQAVVYDDTRRVAVHEVPDAVIEDPGDVVIRVTSTAISNASSKMALCRSL